MVVRLGIVQTDFHAGNIEQVAAEQHCGGACHTEQNVLDKKLPHHRNRLALAQGQAAVLSILGEFKGEAGLSQTRITGGNFLGLTQGGRAHRRIPEHAMHGRAHAQAVFVAQRRVSGQGLGAHHQQGPLGRRHPRLTVIEQSRVNRNALQQGGGGNAALGQNLQQQLQIGDGNTRFPGAIRIFHLGPALVWPIMIRSLARQRITQMQADTYTGR